MKFENDIAHDMKMLMLIEMTLKTAFLPLKKVVLFTNFRADVKLGM